ncbi:hypothetical protein C0J52_01442 [Blattella germanica]|nr:hypothetical protein C0J52_01442 [Blattella germanica]
MEKCVSEVLSCRRCRAKLNNGLKCINCNNKYHPSCAKLTNNVIFLDGNVIKCCSIENSEISENSVLELCDDNGNGNSKLSVSKEVTVEMKNEIYDALSAIANKNNMIDIRIISFLLNGKDAVIRELKDQINILKDQLSLMKHIIVSTNPNTNTKVRFSKINLASLYGYSESSNSECQFVENGDKHNINSEFRCQEHNLLDSDIK